MSTFGRHDILGSLQALQRYARALTRDHGRAEDLVHDTLLRAIERRSTYRDGESLINWLRSILHNTFIDERRRADADIRHVQQVSSQTETESPPDQESRLHLQEVSRLFDDLPEDQRAALYLVVVEDMSYRDAADSLNIPVGTLMSRIGRARDALRAAGGAEARERPPFKKNLRLLRNDR
ncbi:sigma-70 family RNA polymerase sigma factor [Bradyrhizobium prioriisuperbiae]|uniref:sigma-70 family RNA polymerase sigma factor n=1 Tax=Bradyrhizobium prioriisuperbiae TaxID=2854389 RepID=UPI0028ED4681|nr:sigma-70 family RNA polymerase sigma factor [Bradyrhizobium prioritasuperba]